LTNRLLAAFEKPVPAAADVGSFGLRRCNWPNPVLVPLTVCGRDGDGVAVAHERNILPLGSWGRRFWGRWCGGRFLWRAPIRCGWAGIFDVWEVGGSAPRDGGAGELTFLVAGPLAIKAAGEPAALQIW